MTLDEARKLKPGDEIIVDGFVGEQYFIGVTKSAFVVFETEKGDIYHADHGKVGRPLVYEWRWVYSTFGKYQITDGYFAESEYLGMKHLVQRIDKTKRVRES